MGVAALHVGRGNPSSRRLHEGIQRDPQRVPLGTAKPALKKPKKKKWGSEGALSPLRSNKRAGGTRVPPARLKGGLRGDP